MQPKSAHHFQYYLVFAVNVISVIGNGIVIGFAIYMIVREKQLDITGSTNGIAIYALLVGLLDLGSSALGCFAAKKRQKQQLSYYVLVAVISMILKILCIALVVSYWKQTKDYLDGYFSFKIQEIERTDGKSSLTRKLLQLQERLKCCGANHRTDWNDSARYCPSKYQQGCVTAIRENLNANLAGMGITANLLTFFQFIAIMTANHLVGSMVSR